MIRGPNVVRRVHETYSVLAILSWSSRARYNADPAERTEAYRNHIRMVLTNRDKYLLRSELEATSSELHCLMIGPVKDCPCQT